MASIGSHCVLEMYDCPEGLLNDPAFVREAVRQAAVAARSTLLEEVQHVFDPQGVTALALLAESHISVHTWPETGYAAADVFTCGEHTEPRRACEFLVRKLQARRFSLREIRRGAGAGDVRPATELPPATDDAAEMTA
ncbi:MAG: adenosylmethionine decarboxylase [Acidobacteriota bacterium]|nr:adenosylmethionine decarboxylase [Acidobacteriota bacterium]MDQ7088176.1 adenosylmethionine decarboxylase [Acidobacteriota bacterium]